MCKFDTRPDCSDVSYMQVDMPGDAGDGIKYPELIPWMEKDPNGIPLKQPGAKADAGKTPLLRGCIQYFPRALLAVAAVSEVGANKYSWKGWEKVDGGIHRYGDALARHLAAEEISGPYDAETGALHASQVAWNALARLELILREQK